MDCRNGNLFRRESGLLLGVAFIGSIAYSCITAIMYFIAYVYAFA